MVEIAIITKRYFSSLFDRPVRFFLKPVSLRISNCFKIELLSELEYLFQNWISLAVLKQPKHNFSSGCRRQIFMHGLFFSSLSQTLSLKFSFNRLTYFLKCCNLSKAACKIILAATLSIISLRFFRLIFASIKTFSAAEELNLSSQKA